MPARVSVEMNEEILADVIAELELSNPPSFTMNHSGKFARNEVSVNGKVRGSYHPGTNHVTITSQGESFEKEGLYVLTRHLRFTVLHELRHAWQREHWTEEERIKAAQGPYDLRHEEIDANQWAEYAMPKYRGLVKVNRQRVGKSGFASLDRQARKGTP